MAKSLHLALICGLVGLVPAVRRQARSNETNEAGSIKTNNHIICPVLAALYRGGALKTDDNGDVELDQLYDALHNGLKISEELASFQAYGIVVYDKSQKGIEESRHDCKPPGRCYIARKVRKEVNDDTRRWFNVFEMNGKQALEHGISTGVRGGDTNMPPNAVDCRGQYPCVERFNQFFGDVVTNDRFYLNDIMKVVCKARQYGDRGGEHSYDASNKIAGFSLGPVPGREWQMRGAMSATLFAFGRTDGNGDLFMRMKDMKALFLEGRYPDGWQPRVHGCLASGCDWPAIKRFNLDVPCEVGYDEPFWNSTGCKVDTGRTCGMFKHCQDGETCVGSKCLCSRGGNLRTMCYSNGSCQEQDSDSYSWFGGQRVIFKADNPTPRGNPA